MTRYTTMFSRLGAHSEGAFGAFLMLGDPDLETSAALLDALVDGGADMIEVGIPFSDPIADGPVIQAAATRALRAGTRVDDCFMLLSDFRQRYAALPVGILTYANLLSARGLDRFCADAAGAGVDSLLVADVPALEAGPYADAVQSAGLDMVMIAAPNTPGQTLMRIARFSTGYTYCVARRGVTGVQEELTLEHQRLFTDLRRLEAPPPVLGFGISTPAHVRQAITAGAAGVISGSAIVRLVDRSDSSPECIASFVAAMKEGTRLVGSSTGSPQYAFHQ
ncbi:MAG: tryptophan synthase subunit alpha [Alphaproteobacteria bacterium]